MLDAIGIITIMTCTYSNTVHHVTIALYVQLLTNGIIHVLFSYAALVLKMDLQLAHWPSVVC